MATNTTSSKRFRSPPPLQGRSLLPAARRSTLPDKLLTSFCGPRMFRPRHSSQVTSQRGWHLCEVLDEFARCRTRRSSRSLGTPCRIDRRGLDYAMADTGVRSDFRLPSTCPGALHGSSLWHKGTMLRTQAVEVIGYFAAGNNPSSIFSMVPGQDRWGRRPSRLP